MILKVTKESVGFRVSRRDDAKAVVTEVACLDWSSVQESVRDLKLPPMSLIVMRQQVDSIGFAETNLPSTWLVA
jgi:hypothetical protein